MKLNKKETDLVVSRSKQKKNLNWTRPPCKIEVIFFKAILPDDFFPSESDPEVDFEVDLGFLFSCFSPDSRFNWDP